MNLQATETFDRTWIKYHDKLSDEEWADRCEKYQKEGIIGLPSTFRYNQVVSMGGSRSSKTYSILQLLLTEMVSRKNIKITVWRSTKTECRANVMDNFLTILRDNPDVNNYMIENKQKATFTYSLTGSKIIFEGSDDVGKVLGSTQHISFFNEVTEFSKAVYLQIAQRTSERILCDYNPSKTFWLESYRFDEESTFIHSDFTNNIFCPVPIQKRLLSYEPWEKGSYEIRGAEVFYNDKPITERNQPPPHKTNTLKNTQNEYMWLVYGLGLGAEKPNKIYKGWHGIDEEEFDSKAEYTSYFGLDFGTSVPTALCEVKYDGDGSFYVKPRLYKPMQDIEENIGPWLNMECPDIKSTRALLIGDSAKWAYIDSLINSGYNADGAIKGSGSVDLGISSMQKFQMYVVFDDDLKSEYDEYSWEVDKNGVSRDVPLKKNDHYMDSIRYIITYLIDYLRIEL
jgi:phage terminase large subunit